MPFPFIPAAIAAVSAAGSFFGPKPGQRTEGIADEIGIGDKFNDLFSQFQGLSTGTGGALTEEQIRELAKSISAQSQPILDDIIGQSFRGSALRGVADSPVAGAVAGDAARRFGLQQTGKFSDLLVRNATQGFQGRQSALSNLTQLLGFGLDTNRSADASQTSRANRFSESFGNLTGSITDSLFVDQLIEALGSGQRQAA